MQGWLGMWCGDLDAVLAAPSRVDVRLDRPRRKARSGLSR